MPLLHLVTVVNSSVSNRSVVNRTSQSAATTPLKNTPHGHRVAASMKFKFSLFFIFFVVALSSLIAFTLIRQLQLAAASVVYTAGMPVLQRASDFIDGDKFEKLVQTLDPSDPFFIETQEKFRQLKTETQSLYLYAMAPYQENVHLFIFDAEEPDSENFSPLGEKEALDSYDRAYLLTYKTKSSQFVPRLEYHERWGRILSAYMPIFNSNGDVVGVIGIDFHGNYVYDAIILGVKQLIAFAVVFILLGLIFYFYLIKGLAKQNEELLRLSEAAEAASRAKSDFLARMSHEIRTPLNAITGFSELAHQERGQPETQEYIASIKCAGDRLLGVINDILDISKIESGQLTTHDAPYDTASLLKGVLTIIRFKATAKSHTLTTDIAPDIPGAMIGDDRRIRQILLNLLDNAVKYTEDGGLIRLTVSGEKTAENAIRLTLSVEDSGIGIKPDELPKIFEEFMRLDEKRNSAIEGTGLGLPITHSLCRAMGGDLAVSSEYGKGSVFIATLMQSVCEWKPIHDVASPMHYPQIPIPTFFAPKAEVLIVDDFSDNLRVAAGLLRPYRMRVHVCRSGREALDLVQSHDFDLVLMDHMMPVMDGVEATTYIRALGGRFVTLPIVALTANATHGMREFFLERGFSDYISKPIEPAMLDAVLAHWIPKEKQGPAELSEQTPHLPDRHHVEAGLGVGKAKT